MADTDTVKETIKFIKDNLFAQAKAWKSFYAGDNSDLWIDDIRWYKGQQWSQARFDSKEKSSIFFNRLFSTIQRELPFMTDRRPRLRLEPTEPSDKPFAQIFERILDMTWVNRGMPMKLPEALLHAKQLGIGFFRPIWNPELANGQGDIDCEVPDPLEVFPFAYTKELKTGEGLIWARWVSLGWVRKNFDNGKDVKATVQEDKSVPDRAKETNIGSGMSFAQITNTQGTTTNFLPSPSGTSIHEDDLKRVLLITAFIKDGSTEDVESEEKVEGKIKKVKKSQLVFPNGRMITIAGEVILEDDKYPFRKFPGFVELINYKNPGEFWPMSDIKQIKEGQKELNKLQAMIIDAVKRGVYTVKFVDSRSGIDADNFVVSSDTAYETNIPNPVTELVPQALPPQVFQYGQVIEQAINTTAGTQEFTTPQSAGSLPSGRALSEFQEITQTRLRLKIRNMESAITEVGRIWLEMIIANYSEQRIMRIFNPKTRNQEFVFIFKEEDSAVAEEIKQKVSQQIVPGTEEKDEQGQIVKGTGTPKYQHVLNMADIEGEFDLTVVSGSTISESRIANFEQSFRMFGAQAIDRTALLDAAEYPEKEEVLRRMDEAAHLS